MIKARSGDIKCGVSWLSLHRPTLTAGVANSAPVHTAHFSIILRGLPSVGRREIDWLPWVGTREFNFSPLSHGASDLLQLEGDR